MSKTLFARLPAGAAAWAASIRSRSGSVSPSTERAPTLRKSRRETPSHCRQALPNPSLIILVIEHELFTIEQCPEQILEALLAGGGLSDSLFRGLALGGGGA